MNVYVDEAPKDCLSCPCNSEMYYCNLLNEAIDCGGIPRNCPLKSLAEHDKQVKKQICEDIREVGIVSFDALMQDETIMISGCDLEKIEKGETK